MPDLPQLKTKAIKYLEAIIQDSYLKDDKERLAELAKVNKELQTLQTRLTNAQTLMLDGAFDAAEYKESKPN